MSESDTPGKQLPDPRPSYIQNVSSPNRNMSNFKMDVVKELDPDFQAAEVTPKETSTEAVQEEEEKIRTFLRIRPSKNDTELFKKKDATTLSVSMMGGNRKTVNSEKSDTLFKFTKILGPESTQIQVFDECVTSLLEKLLNKENCLIFGYGATNSGKTHTMQGYGSDFGIVPRTLEYLFNYLEDKLYLRGDMKPHMFNQMASLSEREVHAIHEMKVKILLNSKAKLSQADMDSFTSSLRPSLSGSAVSGSSSNHLNMHASIINSAPAVVHGEKFDIPDDATLYGIWVSFAELYNEKVYDLFDSTNLKKRKEMKLMADRKGHVYIKDLMEVSVTSAEEAYKLFLAGKANLRFASTEMNANSSRSHCFFSVRIVTVGTTKGNVYPKTVQRLSFCDLAGAERASQTGNIGSRLKESGNINQSLLVLLRCIRAMRDLQCKKVASSSDFVPFRESKLTRLFQSYLTTASHICMIVNINPDPRNFESTLQVLHNSAIASEVIAFRKVEPPSNNSKFYKKVRESISFSQSIHHKLSNTNVPDRKENEDRYSCKTVVAKPKIVDNQNEQRLKSSMAYIEKLQSENTYLKENLEEKTDEVVRLRSILALKDQNDKEASMQSEQYQKAFDIINDKRLSLQARILRDDHDKEIALLKQKFETELELSDDYETLTDEDEDKENCPTDPFRTPKPVHLSKTLSVKNKKIKELTEANEDLTECVKALQSSVDIKDRKIVSITMDFGAKERMHLDIIEDQKSIMKHLEDEIRNFRIRDPKAREEETKQQIMKLNKVNELLIEENAILKGDLLDGQTTCMEYDRKLEEANTQIETINSALNSVMAECRNKQEELDIIHCSFGVMQDKLKKYEKYDREKTTTGTVTTPTLSCGIPLGQRRYKYRATTPTKMRRRTKSKQDVSMASHSSKGTDPIST